MLARGRVSALLNSERYTEHACTILRRATNMYRSSDGDNATDREVLVAAGCCTIDVQVAMLRLLFFGRLVRWGTAPLFAVLQAGRRASQLLDNDSASGSGMAPQI